MAVDPLKTGLVTCVMEPLCSRLWPSQPDVVPVLWKSTVAKLVPPLRVTPAAAINAVTFLAQLISHLPMIRARIRRRGRTRARAPVTCLTVVPVVAGVRVAANTKLSPLDRVVDESVGAEGTG